MAYSFLGSNGGRGAQYDYLRRRLGDGHCGCGAWGYHHWSKYGHDELVVDWATEVQERNPRAVGSSKASN